MDDLFGDSPPPRKPVAPPVRSTEKKVPTFYPIPADSRTRRARCKGSTCDATVYWVEGRRFPISTDYEGCSAPDANAPRDGQGISHYVNCPDVGEFSGRNRGK